MPCLRFIVEKVVSGRVDNQLNKGYNQYTVKSDQRKGSYRRRTEYLEHGIPLPLKLAEDMEELGRELSVSLNWKV